MKPYVSFALIFILVFVFAKSQAQTTKLAGTIQNWLVCDDRDGQEYKVVQIGNQLWLAENMNIEIDSSWCYENIPANCDFYGRLYTWKSATEACPLNWRLPSRQDWGTLIEFLGGETKAGGPLKTQHDWYSNGDGTNSSQFSALPSGLRDPFSQSFYRLHNNANFWCADEYDNDQAWFYSISTEINFIANEYFYKEAGLAVRCILD